MTTASATSLTEHTEASPSREAGAKQRTAAKRINVAVNAETLAALENVCERENVSLTEAVRRLIGIGDVMYRAAKEDQGELLIRTETETKQIVIL
jgi:hypothetical protein